MNLLSKIKNKIITFFLGFIRSKKEKRINSFNFEKDEKKSISKLPETEKINTQQLQDNNSIIDTNEDQKKLIENKCEILNIRNFDEDLEKIKEIKQEIERLETNYLLQSRMKFTPVKIGDELLSLLFIGLNEEEQKINLLQSNTEKRLKSWEERKNDVERINNLKNDVLNYSLTKISKERKEKRKEQERIERERKINEQYEEHLKKSKEFLSQNNFDKATYELTEAKKIKPDKESELYRLLSEVKKKKEEFNKRLEEFNNLLKKAENKFHEKKYEEAINLYEKAKRLNIDNTKCESRIYAAKEQIQRQKELEERLREERERREKFKDDGEEIIQYFKKNGINQFYHYTDSRNINSILQNSGLYSLNKLRQKGISFIRGSETEEMADYIRLSYTKNHPLMYVSIREGRIFTPVILEIDIEVAKLRETMFTNVNAARTTTPPTVKMGEDLKFIKKYVKLNVVKMPNQFQVNEEEKPYYQAEILVKDHLELKYIKNYNNQN